MKSSAVTGEFIYKEMEKLYKKQEGLLKAVDQVANEIGAGSDAYVYLKEALDKVQEDIKKLESIEYTMQPTIPQDYEPKAPSGYGKLPAGRVEAYYSK
jgi:hypothetical protein